MVPLKKLVSVADEVHAKYVRRVTDLLDRFIDAYASLYDSTYK
jgi:hypothetical protein